MIKKYFKRSLKTVTFRNWPFNHHSYTYTPIFM